jgi:hypothetical protein
MKLPEAQVLGVAQEALGFFYAAEAVRSSYFQGRTWSIRRANPVEMPGGLLSKA